MVTTRCLQINNTTKGSTLHLQVILVMVATTKDLQHLLKDLRQMHPTQLHHYPLNNMDLILTIHNQATPTRHLNHLPVQLKDQVLLIGILQQVLINLQVTLQLIQSILDLQDQVVDPLQPLDRNKIIQVMVVIIKVLSIHNQVMV